MAGNDATSEIRLGLEPNPTSLAMGISAEEDPTKLYNPGGVTGVWAESNTRADIWDALHRRETFATRHGCAIALLDAGPVLAFTYEGDAAVYVQRTIGERHL